MINAGINIDMLPNDSIDGSVSISITIEDSRNMIPGEATTNRIIRFNIDAIK